MEVGGIKYSLVVTSANDFDCLSLECTLDNELLIEAELVDYQIGLAKIHFHKQGLPLGLVEAFVNEAALELKNGASKSS